MSIPFTKSRFFQKNIHPFLSKIPGYDYWLLRRKSYLKTTGWFRSFKEGRSVNRDGQPIPWFVYGLIELIDDRLPDHAVVFEYGCGLGTSWWAGRAKRVDAVEHEKKWFEMMEKRLPENTNLMFRKLGEGYEKAIYEFNREYDIIIIDGRNRVECCRQSVDMNSKQGVIILDDTGRKEYSEGIIYLKERGYRQLAFKGFSPIEFLPCETSVFYRDGNILGL